MIATCVTVSGILVAEALIAAHYLWTETRYRPRHLCTARCH